MSNGDCPVGAENSAYIKTLQHAGREMNKKQDDICRKIDGVRGELQEFKSSFQGWVLAIMGSVLLLLIGVIINMILLFYRLPASSGGG